jgi:predicted ester cyclase
MAFIVRSTSERRLGQIPVRTLSRGDVHPVPADFHDVRTALSSWVDGGLDMRRQREDIEMRSTREVVFMSLETTTQTMNSYFESLLNGGDFDKFFTDDVEWTTVETGEKATGRRAVRDYIISMHRKTFDAHPEVKKIAIGDGVAAVEADFVGTHTGDFAGIAPTGAAVCVPYCVFYDVDDDGISALRAYLPIRQMMVELQAEQAEQAARV